MLAIQYFFSPLSRKKSLSKKYKDKYSHIVKSFDKAFLHHLFIRLKQREFTWRYILIFGWNFDIEKKLK